ncbi:putative tetratricopeptide-like helical domain superfamily [Helianthus annuus]|nr:putative tetratricopeptide-like helical domain superfamily [Helianthus annuus]
MVKPFTPKSLFNLRPIFSFSSQSHHNHEHNKYPNLVNNVCKMLTNPRWFENLELKHVSHTLNHTHVARIVSSVKDLDVVVRFFYWITKTYSYKHDLNCYKAMLNRLVRERRPRLGDTDQIRVLMVKECTTEGQLMQVVDYFNEIRGKGVGYSLYSCNALLIQMGKFRMVEAARDVFGKMLGYGIKPSLLTFNTMINMLCEKGNGSRSKVVV